MNFWTPKSPGGCASTEILLVPLVWQRYQDSSIVDFISPVPGQYSYPGNTAMKYGRFLPAQHKRTFPQLDSFQKHSPLLGFAEDKGFLWILKGFCCLFAYFYVLSYETQHSNLLSAVGMPGLWQRRVCCSLDKQRHCRPINVTSS